MRRRLGREDIYRTNPFLEDKELQGSFGWRVYDEFDIVVQEGREPFFKATTDESDMYPPLVETPYLFLEFARLPEQKDHIVSALHGWLTKYGLLGLSRQAPRSLDRPPEVQLNPEMDLLIPEISTPPLRYDAAGGPGDTFHAYMIEVSKANALLTFYEAVLNRDVEGLEQCLASRMHGAREELRQEWGSALREAPESNPDLGEDRFWARDILDEVLIYDSLPDEWGAFLIDKALRVIWQEVGTVLSIFTYPTITSVDMTGPLTAADKLTSTWRPRNLLGALYLQFFWLITSQGELDRCQYCNRIISYAPPMPGSGKRKTYRNKKFCSTQCRQNYHYHNVIKPKRNARRNGGNA
jgi:hypothetical protein